MKHSYVIDTSSSLSNQEQNIIQHLELDVVEDSLIQKGKKLSDEYKLICNCLLCLITGLSLEVMSGDVWILATISAKEIAKEQGISEDKFNEIIQKVLIIKNKLRNRNPMSGMF